MNSGLRFEFDLIQQDQARLRRRVADLDQRIDVLGRKLTEDAEPTLTLRPSPPPLPRTRPSTATLAAPSTSTVVPTTEKAPILSEIDAAAAATPAPQPASNHEPTSPREPASTAVEPEAKSSWELTFGTVWLARIGIVILITGLVFLGNYAWQHVVSQLGGGGKLVLLYLAGGILMALGSLLERGKEAMRNYARVLMAGGAATIYYATYAAHYVEQLRVIENPLIGGMLLLAVAGGFIAWADRRRSQTNALLAILLAYYTSAINAVGAFSLFSGLLLTGTAVFFLVRHRWAALGWVSIPATYGSYAFWKWHQAIDAAAHAGFAEPTSSTIPLVFLVGYWALFSIAAFIGKGASISNARPTLFVTANNTAFFLLVAQQLSAQQAESFWAFSIVFGAALLGLAFIAKAQRRAAGALEVAYLAQGVGLITLGLVSKLTGSQLALTLAFESVLLLTAAGRRHGWFFQIVAALVAAGAIGVTSTRIEAFPDLALSLGGPVAVVMLGNAWWLKQRRGQLQSATWSWRSAWFVGLGLMLLGQTVWETLPLAYVPVAVAIIAILMTVVSPRLRVSEWLLGQTLLGWGLAIWIEEHTSVGFPTLTTVTLLAASFGLEQWWQRQQGFQLDRPSRGAMQLICALGGTCIGYKWLGDLFPDRSWMAAASAAALGTVLYGVAVRSWATTVTGQIFTFSASGTFLVSLLDSGANGAVALAPIASMMAIGVLIERLGRKYANVLPESVTVSLLARIYRYSATIGFALWGLRFVSSAWQLPFFAGLGATLLFVGSLLRNRECTFTGTFFHSVALLSFWILLGEPINWLSLLAIVSIPAGLRVARYCAADEPALSEDLRRIFTAVATASAWFWVTRWTLVTYGSQGLTVAWSAFALVTFAAGLGLHERVYRLAGFGVLALTIGRVFTVDVWRLETLYRILSFLVLGVVLLLLGFVYNRFAERIRKWL